MYIHIYIYTHTCIDREREGVVWIDMHVYAYI